ncbi:hypothetical protein [Granulicella sp. dw_53]|uniref:hypothetical protein n=1 Tax=Granulicella sp. dw_53 TaxID=2719792 RepID=UPI001BD4B3B6|nr:hypothetical protein [Granulicella sp. dw_53]
MKLNALSLFAVALVLVSGSYVVAQSSSTSAGVPAEPVQNESSLQTAPSPGRLVNHNIRPFSTVGVEIHVGLRGAGFDVATPVARKFNLRAGADFFSYGTTFEEEGADVNADMRLRSGHAALDWFPFGGGFHLSPQIVFANNSQVKATALIPAGNTVTLNGTDYISSRTDPLHGDGSIGFRTVAPGLSVGFGNIVPRSNKHFSFPVEAGFYYVGQPRLNVRFTGSACDPRFPAAIGCESVDNDPDFQRDLAAFIKRNNNNLSYASFLPILSFGVAYKF